MPKSSGFTLIELMVTMTIIGILATIGIVLYKNTQVSARDSKRGSDIIEIQKALEQYYSINRSYPNNNNVPLSNLNASINNSTYFANGVAPTDPSGTGYSYQYTYYYCSSPMKYVACTKPESCSGKCNVSSLGADGCSFSFTPGLSAGYLCATSLSN